MGLMREGPRAPSGVAVPSVRSDDISEPCEALTNVASES